MTKAVLLALPLAGCLSFPEPSDTPQQDLASMPRLGLELYTYADTLHTVARHVDDEQADAEVILHSDDGSCPRLLDGTIATLDGAPLRIQTQGGYYEDSDGHGCEPMTFAGDFSAHANAISKLVIRDAQTTWTIEAADLKTADFSLIGSVAADENVTVTWGSADAMTAKSFAALSTDDGKPPLQLTDAIHDNVMKVRLPATLPAGDVLTVVGVRRAVPITCNGPIRCSISVEAAADFEPSNDLVKPFPSDRR